MVAMMMENPAEKKVRGWLGKVDQHTKEEKEKDRGNIYRTGVLACASLLPCFLASLLSWLHVVVRVAELSWLR
jgi:hypothetical protein